MICQGSESWNSKMTRLQMKLANLKACLSASEDACRQTFLLTESPHLSGVREIAHLNILNYGIF